MTFESPRREPVDYILATAPRPTRRERARQRLTRGAVVGIGAQDAAEDALRLGAVTLEEVEVPQRHRHQAVVGGGGAAGATAGAARSRAGDRGRGRTGLGAGRLELAQPGL